MSKRSKEGHENQAATVDPGAARPQPAPEQGPQSELEALKAQLEQKDKEIAELKDKYLRALADQENARKRIRQQSEESVRLQREAILRELLPIIDNLELAVGAAQGGGNGKSIVEGVEMVLRSMHEFLRAQGVTPEQAVGQAYDPKFHEAVEHKESAEHQPNTVIGEFHRGYRIGERVLRPARVTVAKGSEKVGEGGDPSSAAKNGPEGVENN
jgi:molecular chaperone GrpE